MKQRLLVILCMLAAGCSTRGQVNPDVMQVATAPLTCASQPECTLWWQRAQSWVSMHSVYPVESANDTLIQTAGPEGGKRALAYQITKTQNSDGTATIGFAAHCDSSLGCKPNPWEAGANFKAFVRNGTSGKLPGESAGAAAATGMNNPAATPAQ